MTTMLRAEFLALLVPAVPSLVHIVLFTTVEPSCMLLTASVQKLDQVSKNQACKQQYCSESTFNRNDFCVYTMCQMMSSMFVEFANVKHSAGVPGYWPSLSSG